MDYSVSWPCPGLSPLRVSITKVTISINLRELLHLMDQAYAKITGTGIVAQAKNRGPVVLKETGRLFVLPLGAGAETRPTYGANDVYLRNRSCLQRENRLRAKTCIAILKRHTNRPKYDS